MISNKRMKTGLIAVLAATTICSFGADDRTSSDMPPTNTSPFDTLQHIKEVVITAKAAGRELMPAQHLQAKQLEQLGSQSVADALRYFAGLQVKDYGGVGGIKTVNIRSMGTNHLGVYYDGVELGNAQNGQTDLGQLSLDNVEEISLYHGQKNNLLQTAADFTKAGSVYIRTRKPQFDGARRFNLKARVKYGASDLIDGSMLWERKIGKKMSASMSIGALKSSGKYRFRYKRKNADGSIAYDTTAVRQNGDIWAFRLERNVFGHLPRGQWNMKFYSYNSERGIPGAIVNNVWRRGERQWDHNHFLQASVQHLLLPRLTSKLVAKYGYYNTRYVNNDSTKMRIDNRYKQKEFYLSSANLYALSEQWTASLSYDYHWSYLDSDMRNFSSPTRHAHALALATAWHQDWMDVQASVVGSCVDDREQTTRAMTPAIVVNVWPSGNKDLALRVYAKKSFRMPTFNDLYYTEVGNATLKPESAIQYDAGFTLGHQWQQGLIRMASLQADVYYNSVHDKIVAYPKGEQFRWTMLNLGKVHITGVDVQAAATAQPAPKLSVTARLQYTWQRAIDVTDPATSYYRDQIPYIPWHSGSATLTIGWGRAELNYSFIYAGERYSQQENIYTNHLEPWYTSDLSVAYRQPLGKTTARLSLQVNNLFSQDYDVILNYPMPKRNANVMLTFEV